MAEFSYTFDQVLEMPLKRFWFLSSMIDRLRADKDIRHIQLLASVGSEEMYGRMQEALKKELGVLYVWEPAPVTFVINTNPVTDATGLDPEFDRAGLQALKARHGA